MMYEYNIKFEKVIENLREANAGVYVRRSSLGFSGKEFIIILSVPESDEFINHCPYANNVNWGDHRALLRVQLFDDNHRLLTVYFGANFGEVVIGSTEDTINYSRFFSLPYKPNKNENYFIVKNKLIDFIINFDFSSGRIKRNCDVYSNNNNHVSNADDTIYPLTIIAIGYRSPANEEKIRRLCADAWPYLKENKHLSIRFTSNEDNAKTINQLLDSAVRRGLL